MKRIRSIFEEIGINSRVTMIFFKFLLIVFVIYFIALLLGGWQYFGQNRLDVLKILFVSFGGNLTFLMVVGLVPTILAFSEPRKEPVQRRVDYLITNEDVSQRARDHIKNEVIKLCAYYEIVDVCVRILSVRQNGSFYAEFLTDSLIRNTFKGDQLSDPDYNMMIEPDQVALDSGVPYGEIILAQVTHNESETSSIIQRPELILAPGPYTKRFGLVVSPSGTSMVRINFRIWCDGSLPCYYHFYRFADHARITLENLTQDELQISKLAQYAGEETILPNQSIILHDAPVKTGRMQIFKFASHCCTGDLG